MKRILIGLGLIVLIPCGVLVISKQKESSASSAELESPVVGNRDTTSSLNATLANRTTRVREIPPKKPSEGDRRVALLHNKNTYEGRLAGDVLIPLDAEKLHSLAKAPHRDPYQFTDLILKAGADRDEQFLYLLDREDLRSESRVDLALTAYEYRVKQNPEALQKLLTRYEQRVAQDKTGDTNEFMVLAWVDEWDLTRKTLQTHQISGDGAGSDAIYSFWLTRRHLYPHNKDFPKDFDEFTTDVFGPRE